MSKDQLPDITAHLLNKVERSQLFPQFREQLQKDIHRAGIEYTLKKTSDIHGLVYEFISLVQQLADKKFNHLLNLLYAADISENKVRKIINEFKEEASDQIAFLIMQREFQKVRFRNQK